MPNFKFIEEHKNLVSEKTFTFFKENKKLFSFNWVFVVFLLFDDLYGKDNSYVNYALRLAGVKEQQRVFLILKIEEISNDNS